MTRYLVPLPYDVSDPANGRNLRIVNLLNALGEIETVTCVSADQVSVGRAHQVLPRADHVAADAIADPCPSSDDFALEGRIQQQALHFFSHHPAIARALRQLAGDHEIVLGFDLPALSPLLAVAASHPAMPVVFDAIDDPWLTWKSQTCRQRFGPAGLKSAVALRVIRHKLLKRLDTILAVAPRDAASLARVSGRPVEVIPNGIHLPQRKDVVGREPLIVFTGTMHFPPNEAAATFLLRQIWPRILGLCGSFSCDERPHLAIVGARPSTRLRRMAEAAGAEVTGYVDDLGHWLQRARVAVAPMVSGSGMKNKILEACAAGCPVVTTPLGADGLPVGEAHGILCARTPDAFAATVVELIRRPEKSRALGAAAADMVASRFTWQASAQKLHSLLVEHLRQGRTPQSSKLPPHAPSATCAPDAKETIIHAVS